MNDFQILNDLPGLTKAWEAVNEFIPLRKIQNEEEAAQMHKVANDLVDLIGDDEDHPLESLLLLVASLLETWERVHVKLPDCAPHEVLRFLLEQNSLKQKDLSDIASPSLISGILRGERAISRRMAKALGERFNVSPSAFL